MAWGGWLNPLSFTFQIFDCCHQIYFEQKYDISHLVGDTIMPVMFEDLLYGLWLHPWYQMEIQLENIKYIIWDPHNVDPVTFRRTRGVGCVLWFPSVAFVVPQPLAIAYDSHTTAIHFWIDMRSHGIMWKSLPPLGNLYWMRYWGCYLSSQHMI